MISLKNKIKYYIVICFTMLTIQSAFSQTPCLPTNSTTNTTICYTEVPYYWNGEDYYSAGKYETVLLNSGGCDSVATLNLTIDSLMCNPIITSFINPYGCTGAGSTIYIEGTHFDETNNVAIGGVNAVTYTVFSDSVISAIIGSNGLGTIAITSPAGTGYFTPSPIIKSLSTVTASARTPDTLKGHYFCRANGVSFGGTSALSFNVVSDSVIIAVIGDGTSGNVAVTSALGTGTINGFVFIPSPFISSFSPINGGNGAIVTIIGKYFTGTNQVMFGGTPADSFSIVSDSIIRAFVSTGASGNVSVTNPYGTGALAGYTYTPTITSFTPMSGAVGTTVSIKGTGFSKMPSSNIVYFGTVKAEVTSSTDTLLSVIVPAASLYKLISVTTTNNNLTAYSNQPFITTFNGGGDITPNSFLQYSNFATGKYPIGCAISDLNGDGKPDLTVPDFTTNSISVLRNTTNNGIISFSPYINDTTGGLYNPPNSIFSSDLDGDGKQDIIVAHYLYNSEYNSGFSVFRNISTTDSINLDTVTNYLEGYETSPFGISAYDIDGDGKPDLIIPNSAIENISIFRNTSTVGKISFANSVNVNGLAGVMSGITIADFNGDGKLDMAVSDENSGFIYVYKNTSTPGNISFAPLDTLTSGFSPFGIISGDIDGDGKPDLIVSNRGNDDVVIFRNTSTLDSISFNTNIRYVIYNDTCGGLAINDLDGDGKLDLILANSGNGEIYLYKNNSSIGAISFLPPVHINLGYGPVGVYLGDIDGDGKVDIVESAANSNIVTILRNGIGEPVSTSLCPPTGNTSLISYTTGNNYQWQQNTGTGFTNISNNSIYTGANSDTLHLNNIPSSWYGYQYQCIVDGTSSDVYTLKFTDTWTGAIDSIWTKPANWSCGTVPDSNTDVIINSGTVELSSSTTIRSLKINSGASLTIKTPYALIVTH
jgi:hypothetical protein